MIKVSAYARRPGFVWLALLGLTSSCAEEPYPDTAAGLTTSEAVFRVMCKRVAKDAYPNDPDGMRFNEPCDGKGDPEGVMNAPNAQRMRSLVQRRPELLPALDQAFGDAPTNGSVPLVKDEIKHFLGLIVPYYDPPKQLIPSASDAIAGVLDHLVSPLDENGHATDAGNANAKRAEAVLAKFEAVAKRKGYRPSNRTLGFLNPILTYPQLDAVSQGLLGFVAEGGKGHDAMVSLLRGSALELADPAKPTDPSDPDRLNTTLHVALGLLLTPDDTLAEMGQGPTYIVQRGADGNALPKAGAAAALPTPFPVPGTQDSLPRGPFAPATDSYEFFDASRTILAGGMREAKGIVQRTDPNKPSTLDNFLRGLRPIMGPTVDRTYDFSGKPYAFKGPDLEQGAMLDLVHAAGTLATYPEVSDAIALVKELLKNHESAAMEAVRMAININDRAKKHPEAVVTGYDGTPNTPNEFWDDVLAVAIRMTQRDGLVDGLVRSFTDPLAGKQGKLYGAWMSFKDDAPYVGEPIKPDGPGPANLGGAYTDDERTKMNTPVVFEYKVPVDRTQPPLGMNRSIWQRTMSLIYGLNGEKICNPQGATLTVGSIIGNLVFPLANNFSASGGNTSRSNPYQECECIEIPNAVEIYGRAIIGKAQLLVKDPSALGLGALSAPLGFVTGVPGGSGFGKIIEVYSDITGLTDAPNAVSLARFIYAPRNKFMSDLMGVQQLSVDKLPMTAWEPNAMFHLENAQQAAGGSFVTLGVPLVKAFDDHELRDLTTGALKDGYLFGDLLATFHRHWGAHQAMPCPAAPMPGSEGCTQSLDPRQPLYARQSGLVSYEPLLVEALVQEDMTGVLQRSATEVAKVTINGKDGVKILADLVTRLITPDPKVTYRDGRKFAYTNTCVVPDGATDAPKSCGCPAGTSEGPDGLCALSNGSFMPKGRIIEGGVPPIYLLLDALKKIDQGFTGANQDRLDPWHQARSNLVDQFLSVDQVGAGQFAMHNQRARFMGMIIFQWVVDRIAAHQQAGDLDKWGPGLADRFFDTFKHPLAAGALDLLDGFWDDQGAAQQWANIAAYMTDPQTNPVAFDNFLVALADTLVLVDREPNITPLVQFASLVVAPDAFDALDNGTTPDVDHGAAYLGVEVAHSAMSVNKGPDRSALSKMLANVVIAGTDGESPGETIFDVIGEVNRRDPSLADNVPLVAGDMHHVFDLVKQFMVDPDHGLKRLYAVIQNRKVHH